MRCEYLTTKLHRLFYRLGWLSVLVSWLLSPPLTVHAQLRGVPTPLCAIADDQLKCYNARGSVRTITAAGETAVDFDISPDGEWLVYRVQNDDQTAIRTVSLYGGDSFEIDPQAPISAEFNVQNQTLVWSPDGVVIAYVLASGLRIATPAQDGSPHLNEIMDKLYIDVRFSPAGTKLAAQSTDGGWTIFELAERFTPNAHLTQLRTLRVSGELAWQDENLVIVAPENGSIYRVNSSDPNAQYEATGITGYFTHLIRTPDGSLRAMSIEIGRGFGRFVTLGTDNTVTPLGDVNIDTRVMWVQGGRTLIYITSGTPILVNPATGLEDTLPVKGAVRVIWSPPFLESVDSTGLDADIMYLAPDATSIPQVWRLVRNGEQPPTALTQSISGIESYAISPDKAKLAVVEAQSLLVLPLTASGIVTPSPTPRFNAPTQAPHFPTTLRRSGAVTLAWNPDSTQIAYADDDGVYLAPADASSPARQIAPNTDGKRFDIPQFSPDGSAVLVENMNAPQGTRDFSVIPLRDNVPPLIVPPLRDNGVDTVLWSVPNNSRVGLLVVQYTEVSKLTFISAEGTQELAAVPAPILAPMYVRNVTNPSLYFFVRMGWQAGTQVVQYYTVKLGASPQPISDPFVLGGKLQISPTGRLALSVQRVDSPTRSNQLIIIDLQNQRKIAIANAYNVTDVQWIF
ncbi:MAG: hypothetical protein KF716_09090 [Anaerolineae bacterium]|nr:hypothetical protein [Anaerolineae bacterium]